MCLKQCIHNIFNLFPRAFLTHIYLHYMHFNYICKIFIKKSIQTVLLLNKNIPPQSQCFKTTQLTISKQQQIITLSWFAWICWVGSNPSFRKSPQKDPILLKRNNKLEYKKKFKIGQKQLFNKQQALSGEACYGMCTWPHMCKTIQKCDKPSLKNEDICYITNKGKSAKNEQENNENDFLQALYGVYKKIRAILFLCLLVHLSEQRYTSSVKSHKYLNNLIT